MTLISPEVWDRFNSSAFYASIITMAVGAGLPHLKFWFTPEGEVRDRCRTLFENWTEAANSRLQELLKQVLQLPDAVSLRGEPPKFPDYISDYTKELLRILARREALRSIEKTVVACHTAVFASLVVGAICLVADLIDPDLRLLVSTVSLLILLTQFLSVLKIREAVSKLSDHEANP